jgi:hypothetical protein
MPLVDDVARVQVLPAVLPVLVDVRVPRPLPPKRT